MELKREKQKKKNPRAATSSLSPSTAHNNSLGLGKLGMKVWGRFGRSEAECAVPGPGARFSVLLSLLLLWKKRSNPQILVLHSSFALVQQEKTSACGGDARKGLCLHPALCKMTFIGEFVPAGHSSHSFK